VVPKTPAVPDIVTAGRATVAVRAPAHSLLRALLEHCGVPLAAPSANAFGYVSPTSAHHVQGGLGDRIECILDGGACTIGIESTIVDVRDAADPVILRPGGVPREAIETVLGRTVRLHRRETQAGVAAEPIGELAPGMLDRHYSPRTPVFLRTTRFEAGELEQPKAGCARVCFVKPCGMAAAPDVFWLSEHGDAAEAARGLFALLRTLDHGGYSRLEFEPAPEAGLGLAINDRLARAAAAGT
jgi:L-threonylcarbamoyladenylate synthase